MGVDPRVYLPLDHPWRTWWGIPLLLPESKEGWIKEIKENHPNSYAREETEDVFDSNTGIKFVGGTYDLDYVRLELDKTNQKLSFNEEAQEEYKHNASYKYWVFPKKYELKYLFLNSDKENKICEESNRTIVSKDIDFSYAQFEELDCAGLNFDARVLFFNTYFVGKYNAFQSCDFNNLVDFRFCEFHSENSYFRQVKFAGTIVPFFHSKFLNNIDFKTSLFSSETTKFYGTIISKKADFSRTIFSGKNVEFNIIASEETQLVFDETEFLTDIKFDYELTKECRK